MNHHPENPSYSEELFRLFLQFAEDYTYDEIEHGFDLLTAVGMTEDTALAFTEAFCHWGSAKGAALVNPFYPFAGDAGAVQAGYKMMLEMAGGDIKGKNFRLQIRGSVLNITLETPPEEFNYLAQPPGSVFQIHGQNGVVTTLLKGTAEQTFELEPKKYLIPETLFRFMVMRSMCGCYFPVNSPMSQYYLPLSLPLMLKEAKVEW